MPLPSDLKALPREDATKDATTMSIEDRKELCYTFLALLILAILLSIVFATTSSPQTEKATSTVKGVVKR